MSKKTCYITAFFSLLFVFMAFFCTDVMSNEDDIIEFLGTYGWECEAKYTDKSEVIIPGPFDLVYENYNEIQLEAGLDLRNYMGKKCTRYTYVITNYPKDTGETVYANVIVCMGKCIGGDICTVSLGGFMHSLKYP